MFCTNCGTKIADGSAHCTSCGTRVEGVGAAANIVSNVAISAYHSMDPDLKKSAIFGGISLISSILSFLIPILFLFILLNVVAMFFGVLALNAGRKLDNRIGYYMGAVGLIAGVLVFYLFLFVYAVKTLAMSAFYDSISGLFHR